MERKRISDATWRRPPPSTSMGSAGGLGEHNCLFMPSSVPKAAAPKNEMNRHEERMERDTRPICR